MTRSQFSEDDIKQIGLRIRSARVLSGMNQEEFANAHGIPHMSLKGWEMGKALPRQTGIDKYLGALSSIGIKVDPEWLLSGNGAGPTYTSLSRSETPIERASSYFEQQIALFKKEQRAKGFNPLVVDIEDEMMAPAYNVGDVVGGIVVTDAEARAKYMNMEKIFLVRTAGGSFAPRKVHFAEQTVFISSLKDPNLIAYPSKLLASICWHYFPESHT